MLRPFSAPNSFCTMLQRERSTCDRVNAQIGSGNGHIIAGDWGYCRFISSHSRLLIFYEFNSSSVFNQERSEQCKKNEAVSKMWNELKISTLCVPLYHLRSVCFLCVCIFSKMQFCITDGCKLLRCSHSSSSSSCMKFFFCENKRTLSKALHISTRLHSNSSKRFCMHLQYFMMPWTHHHERMRAETRNTQDWRNFAEDPQNGFENWNFLELYFFLSSPLLPLSQAYCMFCRRMGRAHTSRWWEKGQQLTSWFMHNVFIPPKRNSHMWASENGETKETSRSEIEKKNRQQMFVASWKIFSPEQKQQKYVARTGKREASERVEEPQMNATSAHPHCCCCSD